MGGRRPRADPDWIWNASDHLLPDDATQTPVLDPWDPTSPSAAPDISTNALRKARTHISSDEVSIGDRSKGVENDASKKISSRSITGNISGRDAAHNAPQVAIPPSPAARITATRTSPVAAPSSYDSHLRATGPHSIESERASIDRQVLPGSALRSDYRLRPSETKPPAEPPNAQDRGSIHRYDLRRDASSRSDDDHDVSVHALRADDRAAFGDAFDQESKQISDDAGGEGQTVGDDTGQETVADGSEHSRNGEDAEHTLLVDLGTDSNSTVGEFDSTIAEIDPLLEYDEYLKPNVPASEWEAAEAALRDDLTKELDEGIPFYDFDPDAQQDPWQTEPDDEALRLARQKAAGIVARFAFPSETQRTKSLEWLVEVFSAFPHRNSFRAIRSCIDDGLDLDILRDMVALKSVWQERLEFSSCRYIGDLRTDTSLSWRLAWRICTARADFDPENMVDNDWLDDWRRLRPGEPGYGSFAEYVSVTIRASDAPLLDEGLALLMDEGSLEETGDRYDWPLHLPYENPFGTVLRQGPRSHFDYHPIQLIAHDDPEQSQTRPYAVDGEGSSDE